MARLLALIFLVCLAAGCGGNDAADEAGTTTAAPAEASGPLAAADLTGVKSYLTDHTDQLVGFTERFNTLAQDYDKLAASVDYDHARLLSEHRAEVAPLLAKAKDLWTEGNPYYERMEGIVAGTPSLAEYDIIIDAGSSKAEDPESAVPFDLRARRRTGARAARQSLQPDGGDALGHAAGVHRPRQGRSQRGREGRLRRGAAGRARLHGRRGCIRPLRGRALHQGAGLAADPVGRVHRRWW